MPKLSYGPAAKRRVAYLFTVLLDYANDELEVEEGDAEAKLGRLRSHLNIHWEGDRHLIVRTKLRYLATLSALAPEELALTTAQIKDAFKYLEQFLGILEDNRASRRGSDTWHFTLTLWSQRWDRQGNLAQFDRHWEDCRTSRSKRHTPSSPSLPSPSLTPSEPSPNTDTEKETERVVPLDGYDGGTDDGGTDDGGTGDGGTRGGGEMGDRWQQLCRRDLEQRQHTHLTTNPLTSQDGLSFTLDEMYVPLNLVKRAAPPDRDLEDDRAAPTLVSPHDFFDQLQHPMLNRVAIVGDPGAGKTTLLQQLAHWVLTKTDALPIWISLADLAQQSLEDYLIQTWVRQALGQYRVDETTIEALVEQVNRGRVWLFLDAVDEMALPSGLVLTRLAKQMTGWLAQAKIILTCRQTVWDGGKNALSPFETYECCSFNETASTLTPTVQFIQNWFQSTPALAEQLWQTLNHNQFWRLKALATNPLRLALLCRIWSVGQGQLPTTKARLYGQFVEAIYVWKQDYFPTSLTQQYQLNQALGELALQAMMQPEPLFRFPQTVVHQVFQSHHLGLLELALQLGWLKGMGRSPHTQECLYGFYHGSFQEYFAAQALPDWTWFLARSVVPSLQESAVERSGINSHADALLNDNAKGDSPAEPGERRTQPLIFDPQWREVFLLWLGRTDIPHADKCALLDALMTFEDEAGGFFRQRAYFLVARGLAECPDYPQAEAIAQQLVVWGFASGEVPVPIREGARRALTRTDQRWAIAALETFLTTSTNAFERWTAAYSLGKTYDPGNPTAIATLETIIDHMHNPHLQMNVARGLGVVDPGNATAINTLTGLLSDPTLTALSSTKAAEFKCKVALRLGQIDPGNVAAIATLVSQIDALDDEFPKKRAYQALATIAPDHSYVKEAVQQDVQQNASTSSGASSAGRQPGDSTSRPTPDQLMNATLEKLAALAQDPIQNTDRYWNRCLRLAVRLERYQPGHKRAIAIYLDCLRHAQQKSLMKQAFGQLQQLEADHIPQIFRAVRDLYCAGGMGGAASSDGDAQGDDTDAIEKREVERSRFCYRLLWDWADRLGYSIFCQLWQGEGAEDQRWS